MFFRSFVGEGEFQTAFFRADTYQAARGSASRIGGNPPVQNIFPQASQLRGLLRTWIRMMVVDSCGEEIAAQVDSQLFSYEKKFAFEVAFSASGKLDNSLHPLPHKSLETIGSPRRTPTLKNLGGGVRHSTFSFTLHFRSREDSAEAKACWLAIEAGLWAFLRLGGIGFRARRGAGSCKLTEGKVLISPSSGTDLSLSQDENLPEFFFVRAQTKETLQIEIDAGLHYFRQALTKAFPLSSFPVSAPSTVFQNIEVNSFQASSEQEARAELMLKLRQAKNPIFGLPYRIDGNWVRGENIPNRFPSPLFVHIDGIETETENVQQINFFAVMTKTTITPPVGDIAVLEKFSLEA
jgi:hypothetical protein